MAEECSRLYFCYVQYAETPEVKLRTSRNNCLCDPPKILFRSTYPAWVLLVKGHDMLNKSSINHVSLQPEEEHAKLQAQQHCIYSVFRYARSRPLDFFLANVYPSMPSSSAFSILIMSSILRIVMAASVANCSTGERAFKTCFIQNRHKTDHVCIFQVKLCQKFLLLIA